MGDESTEKTDEKPKGPSVEERITALEAAVASLTAATIGGGPHKHGSTVLTFFGLHKDKLK